MEIEIRKPKLEEWESYKNLRLKALKEFPIAFASDYEVAMTKDDEHWKGWIKKSEEEKSSFMLFAYLEERPIGMMAAYWEDSPKLTHIVNLVGVYVDSDFHGQGIGKKLIAAMIEKFKSMNFRKIRLGVTATNENAIALYEKSGFQKVGLRKEEIFYDGKYYDEVDMELYLV